MSGPLADFSVDRRVLLTTSVALFIGALSAGVAWCLLKLIGLVTNVVFYQRLSDALVSPVDNHHPWWLILGAPVAGGLVIGLMARYGSDQVRGHGMPETIEVILTGSSRVEPKVAILKPISAAISIGTGGPFGAEGPIVMTGGAMGSVVAQFLHLTADERKILLASGAAGGIAATFNAPLASILLAVELLLFEFRPRSLVPVASAVAMATVMRTFILGAGAVFPVEVRIPEIAWPIDILAAAIGLAGALVAIGASHLVFWAENVFPRLPIHWMWWPAIGGLIIGVGGLVEPHALGVGYNVIDSLLTGRAGLSLIVGILVVKTAIWALSLGSGTSGGVFAPVFMIGSALGAFVGQWLPHVFPGFWAMLGLAAVVCGLMRAPFAAIAFTLELTRAWPTMLPVIITTITAYVVSVLMLSRSVLTEKITRTGMHLTRDYTTDPLEAFLVAEVMRAGPVPTPGGGAVSARATLRHAANVFAETEGLPLRVLSPAGADQGHLLLKDLLTAHLHDFNEETERTRHLIPYFPKPPRSVVRRWAAARRDGRAS